MEELLNKLIEKGWKPFGIEGIKEFHLRTYECERGTNKIMIKHFEGYFTDGIKTSDYPRDYGSRMYVVYGLKHIVAKESGLWQFVCENYLIELNGDEIEKKYKSEGEYPLRYEKHYGVYHSDLCRQEFIKYETPEFWIIESALCNEEDLEKFLLDNIKI